MSGTVEGQQINAAYAEVLGRYADEDTLDQAVQRVWAGAATVASIRQEIAHTGEAADEVNGVFEDVLGRAAGDEGVNTYERALAGGSTLDQVRWAVAHSDEAGNDIKALYEQVLHREADTDGLQGAENSLASGATLGDVRAGLVNSDEVHIRTLYEEVLGRPADAGGLGYFENKMKQGASLGDVRWEMAHDAGGEAARDIDLIYQAQLQRGVDQIGLAQYEDRLAAGLTMDEVRAAVAASPEKQLKPIYQQLLHRDADADGVATYGSKMTTGQMSLADVRTKIATSDEETNHVQQLYGDVLGRAASYDELVVRKATLATGQTLDGARIEVAYSVEAAANVQALCQAVFGRTADAAGLAAWQAELASGTSLAGLRTQFATSDETAARIKDLYVAELGRGAGQGEPGYWQSQLINGASLDDVRVGIATAPPQNNTPPESATRIRGLYQQVLGRDATNAEVAGQEDALAGGQSLAGLQSTMATSDEAARKITDLCQQLLGRPTDAAGLANWQAELAGGKSLATLRTEFAISGEAGDAVQRLYQQTVGRTADYTNEVGWWQRQMADHGLTLADVHQLMATSPESANDIRLLYQGMLGRDASDTEVTGQQAALAGGESLVGLRSAMAYSDEAARQVTTWCQQLLGRPTDDAGLADWQAELVNGTTTMAGLRTQFATSPEAGDQVRLIYQQVVSRAVSDTDVAYWQQQLVGGLTLADVRRLMATGPEAAGDIDALYQQFLGYTDPGGRASWQGHLADGSLTLAGLRTQFAAAAASRIGQGNAEILYHKAGVGYAVARGDGTLLGTFGDPGADWSVAGFGDLNGDGQADILWRHAGGLVVAWMMNGASYIGGGMVGSGAVDNSWQIAGLGDLNGDGKDDIVWRNTSGDIAAWMLSGNAIVGGGEVGAIDPSWQVAGVADFNADSRADILLRNADGSLVAWLMNANAVIGGGDVNSHIGSSWQLVGLGDLNGDGRADIIWRNADGTIQAWLMNANTIVGSSAVTVASPDWRIASVADLNGDHRADFLWQNANGSTAAWDMNGYAATGGALAQFDPSWQVVGASSTSTADQLNQLYQLVLGRDADAGGLATFGGLLASGAWTLKDVMVELSRSTEAHNHGFATLQDPGAPTAVSQATADARIQAMFGEVLGRGATSSEQAAWEGTAMAGSAPLAAGRTALAAYAGASIQSDYQRVLNRAASDAEVAREEAAIAAGQTQAGLVRMLAYSGGGADAINGAYQAVLGRTVRPDELATWQGALANNRGWSLTAIRGALAGTGEAAARIGDLFQQVMGRPVDQQATVWAPDYLKTHSLADLRAKLVDYPETTADIQATYDRVLGGDASDAELAAAKDALYHGQTLAGLGRELATSGEAAADLQEAFQEVIGYGASAADVTGWEGVLANGTTSLGDIRNWLAHSSEAAARTANLFQEVMGRPVDQQATVWVPDYLRTHSLDDLRVKLAAYPETASYVQNLYQRILGRAADAAEVANGQAALAGGQSLDGLGKSLAYSAATVVDVDAIYLQVLGREADPDAIAWVEGNLANGTWSLLNAKSAVAHSDEATRDIQAISQATLGRYRTTGELDGDEGNLLAGSMSLAAYRDTLATSTEAQARLRSWAQDYLDGACAALNAQAGTRRLVTDGDLAYLTSALDAGLTLGTIAKSFDDLADTETLVMRARDLATYGEADPDPVHRALYQTQARALLEVAALPVGQRRSIGESYAQWNAHHDKEWFGSYLANPDGTVNLTAQHTHSAGFDITGLFEKVAQTVVNIVAFVPGPWQAVAIPAAIAFDLAEAGKSFANNDVLGGIMNLASAAAVGFGGLASLAQQAGVTGQYTVMLESLGLTPNDAGMLKGISDVIRDGQALAGLGMAADNGDPIGILANSLNVIGTLGANLGAVLPGFKALNLSLQGVLGKDYIETLRTASMVVTGASVATNLGQGISNGDITNALTNSISALSTIASLVFADKVDAAAKASILDPVGVVPHSVAEIITGTGRGEGDEVPGHELTQIVRVAENVAGSGVTVKFSVDSPVSVPQEAVAQFAQWMANQDVVLAQNSSRVVGTGVGLAEGWTFSRVVGSAVGVIEGPAGIFISVALGGAANSFLPAGQLLDIINSVLGGTTTSVVTAEANPSPSGGDNVRFPPDPSQMGHIFNNNGGGHLPDTPENRQLILDVASNRANYIGTASRANIEVFSSIRPDGSQAWAYVLRGIIRNGGVNTTPWVFNPARGLIAPPP